MNGSSFKSLLSGFWAAIVDLWDINHHINECDITSIDLLDEN
jgi:hypothetical protein